MTHNQLKKLADTYGLDLQYVTSWIPPHTDDLRPLIAMPNIVRPLQGDKCQPRTIYRPKDWNAMRKACYERANDTCEICGECPEDKRNRHCLERGTEVLTDKGWKTIETVTTEDVVAGFVPDTETIVWEHPTSTTSNFEEKIYRFKYKTGKGFSVGVSSGHRMLLQDGRTKKYKTVTAEDMKVGTWKNIPSSGRGEGEDTLSWEERLFIALQADGTVERQKNGNYYCRIRVSKKRKQERLAWLAKNVSIPIRELKNPNPGYYGVSFTIPFNGKKFLEAFGSAKMSYKKANDFIDELVKWDGWEGERNGCHGRCYYSSNKEDIDFVQAVCAQASLGTHLTVSNRTTRDWGKWHLNKNKVSENIKPSFNLEIKKRAFYGVTTMEKKLEEYYDDVFCISLPSTYFVARTKGGDVFITGNSHEVFAVDYEHGTATFVGCVCLCQQCVDADTEVLTTSGWKKIPEVTIKDRVACWDKDGSIYFDNPTDTIVTHPDRAIEITGREKKLYFSENHRIPLRIASKQSPTYGQVKDVLAKDYKVSHYYNWLTSGYGVGDEYLSAKERVYIAIEADGHLAWDKENVGTRSNPTGERIRARNNKYKSEDYRYTYHLNLYKSRKIERFKKLLKESGLKYSIVKETPGGYCEFNVWTNVECKHFANCFSINMSGEKALEFIEELVFWDGTHTGSQTSWFTNKKEETDFVQAVAAQCGCISTVCVINRIGNLRKGEWTTPYERFSYAVNFHSVNNEYCAREFKPKTIEWDKPMYCITVPTSYFVARRDGLVFITGNCHLACIHNGRAITLYSKSSPLITKDFLLEGAEKAFTIISSYNRDHPGADLRAYSTYVEYLKFDELRESMLELIKKYDISFYQEDPKKTAKWDQWRLLLDGEEYPTPYKNEKEWAKAMEKKSYNDKFGKGVEINIKPLTDEEVREEHDKLKQF